MAADPEEAEQVPDEVKELMEIAGRLQRQKEIAVQMKVSTASVFLDSRV